MFHFHRLGVDDKHVVALSGYLTKQKMPDHAFPLEWNKRFFTIEGRFLKWYSDEHSNEARGSIDLSTISKLEKHIAGENSFRIIATSRDLTLKAKTNAEKQMWLRAIELYADLARGGDGTAIIHEPPSNRVIRRQHPGSHSYGMSETTASGKFDVGDKAADFPSDEEGHKSDEGDVFGNDDAKDAKADDKEEPVVSFHVDRHDGPRITRIAPNLTHSESGKYGGFVNAKHDDGHVHLSPEEKAAKDAEGDPYREDAPLPSVKEAVRSRLINQPSAFSADREAEGLRSFDTYDDEHHLVTHFSVDNGVTLYHKDGTRHTNFYF